MMNREWKMTNFGLHYNTPLYFLQVSNADQTMQKNQPELLDELH